MRTAFQRQIQLLYIKAHTDGAVLFADIGRRITPITMVVYFCYDAITNYLTELSFIFGNMCTDVRRGASMCCVESGFIWSLASPLNSPKVSKHSGKHNFTSKMLFKSHISTNGYHAIHHIGQMMVVYCIIRIRCDNLQILA